MNEDFSNDKELVVGSFKTIRAFKTGGSDDKFRSLNGQGPYALGEVYEAKCTVGANYIKHIPSTTMIGKYGFGSELWCPPKGHPYQKFQVVVKNDPYIIEIDSDEAHSYLEEEDVLNRVETTGGHKSPFGECTCGFYSFYSQEVMVGPGAKYVSYAIGYSPAVIENTGTVIHGSMGVRSQKMKILGVVGLTHQTVEELLAEFPLDVYDG